MPPQPDPNTGEMLESPDATPRLVCGVRFLKAMPGSGAEMVVEALAAGDGGVGWEKGVSIGWKLLRAPVDGNETEVANALDDEAIEKNFGRPLTLAHAWSRVLAKAATGEELIEKVDAGYWIWAGPKENKVLDDEIKKLIGEYAEKGSFPPRAPSSRSGPTSTARRSRRVTSARGSSSTAPRCASSSRRSSAARTSSGARSRTAR
jgi:hypothetical protein